MWAAVLFSLSAKSFAPDETVSLVLPGWLWHVAVYTVFGATLAWARWRGHPTVRHGLFLGLGGLYALSDEWHQSFVPGREPSVADFGADLVGISLGYALARLIASSRRGEAFDERKEGST